MSTRRSSLPNTPRLRQGASYALRMHSQNFRRTLLLAVLGAAMALAWFPWLDRHADTQASEGLKRALATFATARALGAVLSVAESTEVDLKVLGSGFTTAPGKVLRPLNDLVDKFADMMLLASVAFGVQLLLLKFGGHVVVAMALSAAMLLWVAARWRRSEGAALRWLQPALVILLILRFAVPLASLASEGAYRVFMKPSYDAAYDQVSAITPATSGESESKGAVIGRLKAWKDQTLKPAVKVEAIISEARSATDRIVELIAIFVVQTLLIPLAFLWLCVRILRYAAFPAPRPPARIDATAPTN